MKALRLVGIGRPLQLQEVPDPRAGEREVVVRVRAAGICHSDAHYRAGTSPAGPLPLTLGHEVAGEIEEVASGTAGLAVGDRVCLHYMVTCGECEFCRGGHEQFCRRGAMIGKNIDGGYAELIRIPARNAVRLPASVPFEQAAVAMCSSATALHALRKARLQAGERVAVFGVGGLGLSAVQLARYFGALEVFAVDPWRENLERAGAYGAVGIDPNEVDPVQEIRHLTEGRGVEVSLELAGQPESTIQSIRCLGVLGRAALAGIASRPVEINTYQQLIGRETEIIGVSDHLLSELHLLLELLQSGALELSDVVTRRVPLEAEPVNRALDQLEQFRAAGRAVIVP
ncbi:MAG: zinc-binding dehydrogenase [Spirochaetales bacterium]|nr:zinc-binding dehydrogenase [Spirochaetales bacterium]